MEFRREREATWFELEAIVDRIERHGIERATASELSRLPHLYRATLSSLNVARTISLDENLIDYLEGLSSRAYFCVYTTRRRPWQVVARFFARDFPVAVYRLRAHLLVATLLLLLGVGTAHVMVAETPELFHTFVDASYAQGRGPDSSTEALRQVLFSGAEFGADELGEFSSFLMTHNSRIGMLCFVLGIAFGIPVIYLLFKNGAILGAFSALYASHDLTIEFYSWLLPHGITELLAVLLCAAGGLYIGEAVIFPGEYSRLGNLKRRGRRAGQVVIGAVLLFVIAGLIEGIFRQRVHDLELRYLVATTTACFWMIYLGLWGHLKSEELAAGREEEEGSR